ncbi:S-layer homology domain-containing protein [Paenibacillus beijingensis]|uniref:SLH domain-containing protein n=1 Tax=Paenibacillus beijingensis TaxID=1126833 RepID=A0A0D5NGX9_9BACL|nr:S-layer homology domain-containing protein [Paenibacillus beijingensis]AJY74207.1 hypothetical protein VN24_05995 [Paenibacillus beijingensis]
MRTKTNRRPGQISVRLLGLLLLVAFACPFTTFAETQTQTALDVQLIADQDKVAPGGEASFHLLVHNGVGEAVSKASINLFVPLELEVSSAGEAKWLAELRTLQWSVNDIPANGTAAFDFNLKVGADVQAGTSIAISGTAQSDSGVSVTIPAVRLEAGPQTDQPFFKGYPDGKFHPEFNLSRAEAAAVIARIKNLEIKPDPPVQYADVYESHWARDYIVKVTQEGYMQGSGGKFRPDEPITRAEMTALILRLRGIHPVPLPSFGDVDGHWAQDLVGTAKTLGMVDGLTAIAFEPDQFLRRDEAAKLIDIGLSRGPLADGKTEVVQHFPDVDRTHWAFGWIEEASVIAHEGEYAELGKESLIRYLPEQTEEM